MISSSKSWMSEAQSWLAAPCVYTTAKCLSGHVHSLQVGEPLATPSSRLYTTLLNYDIQTLCLRLVSQTVLSDSAQIRTTLQGFRSVLQEMSQVCDVTTLQQQLVDADRQVADVQDSFTAPLSQLEHAAAVSPGFYPPSLRCLHVTLLCFAPTC